MPKLENYIKDHFDEFDSAEPEPGHFRRFEEKLMQQPEVKLSRFDRSLLLKVAALILILISVSVFLFEFATREIRERFAHDSQATELPFEIREALQYYDNQTNTQLATLHNLTADLDDTRALNASAMMDLNSLDATTDELKKSLAQNPGNEHILNAIIRNQQMKGTMLKTIITQLTQANKQ